MKGVVADFRGAAQAHQPLALRGDDARAQSIARGVLGFRAFGEFGIARHREFRTQHLRGVGIVLVDDLGGDSRQLRFGAVNFPFHRAVVLQAK